MDDLSMKDVKQAYFSKSAPASVILCFSGQTVLVRQIKIKDKKEFLKVIEQEDAIVIDSFIDKLIGLYVETIDGTPIDPLTLVDHERQQLLMQLRINATNSPSALIDHICPKCGTTKKDAEFIFNNIKVVNVNKLQSENLIVSANGNIKFTVDHITRKEMLKIYDYIKTNKISTEVEKEFVHIAASIKEIYVPMDDINKVLIPTIEERIDFVNNMNYDDFEKITAYFTKLGTFGQKLIFNFKCDKCEYANEVEEAKLIDFFIK